MLTTANTTIVSGVRFQVKTVRVKVLRPFLVKGVPQPIGSELEIDQATAGELITANKAVKVEAKPEEVKPEPVQVPRKRSSKNAE